jgi:hypothetical protein
MADHDVRLEVSTRGVKMEEVALAEALVVSVFPVTKPESLWTCGE